MQQRILLCNEFEKCFKDSSAVNSTIASRRISALSLQTGSAKSSISKPSSVVADGSSGEFVTMPSFQSLKISKRPGIQFTSLANYGPTIEELSLKSLFKLLLVVLSRQFVRRITFLYIFCSDVDVQNLQRRTTQSR